MQEGQALVRVADSGLSSVSELLIRMRELAVQAANDTNTTKDRANIQAEIDQILLEMDRTAQQTEIFGFKPLFDPLGEEIENPPSTVEVAFLVDDSRSMSQEIANLKSSIARFKQTLEAASDNIRFGLATIGFGNDNLDVTDLKADIGSSNFDSEIASLNSDPGRSMDTYASIMEATGASTIAGNNDPDEFTFGTSGEKLMVVLTDAEAQEFVLNPPNATQQDASDAMGAKGIRAEVIGRPIREREFTTIVNENGGSFHDIGATGEGVGTALSAIAFDLTQSDPKKLTDEPEVHSGPDADQVIPLNLPSDVRPTTLGVDKGNGSGELTSKAKANQLMDDVDDALKTVLRYQGQAGALLNRLESAQRVQETAATAMDRSVAQMESADISVEAYHLTRDRLRSEAANATLARAFTYQRDMSRSLIGLIGGGFSGVG